MCAMIVAMVMAVMVVIMIVVVGAGHDMVIGRLLANVMCNKKHRQVTLPVFFY